MESRLKRIEFIVVLLFIAVIASIAIQILQPRRTPSEVTTAEKIEEKDLPADVTRDVLDKIIYQVKMDYNHENYDSLYQVFGELAKAQFSMEDITREFEKLGNVVKNSW